MAEWRIKVVRGDTVPETRFWHRRILRRKTRYEETVIAAYIPRNGELITRLNGTTTFQFEAGVYDDILSDLGRLPVRTEEDTAPPVGGWLMFTCRRCGAKPGEPCDSALHS